MWEVGAIAIGGMAVAIRRTCKIQTYYKTQTKRCFPSQKKVKKARKKPGVGSGMNGWLDGTVDLKIFYPKVSLFSGGSLEDRPYAGSG